MSIERFEGEVRHILLELVLVCVSVGVDLGDHLVEEAHQVDRLIGIAFAGIFEVADGRVELSPFLVILDDCFAGVFVERDADEAVIRGLVTKLASVDYTDGCKVDARLQAGHCRVLFVV